MTPALIYELVGYLASALIVLSLMMANLLWLRVINLVGAAVFLVYGLLIDAPPIVVTNAIIVVIDVWYLWRMTRTHTYFALLEPAPDSAYLRGFLAFYEADIRRFQPDVAWDASPRQLRLFVLRDMVPAGLFVADLGPDGEASVRLDYAIPGYRDYRIGRYLYRDRAEFLQERGVRRLAARPATPAQERYLRRVGFQEEADGVYRRALS